MAFARASTVLGMASSSDRSFSPRTPVMIGCTLKLTHLPCVEGDRSPPEGGDCIFRAPDPRIFFGDFAGGSRHNRIVTMWNALMEFFEAKELYDDRYELLMRARGILR